VVNIVIVAQVYTDVLTQPLRIMDSKKHLPNNTQLAKVFSLKKLLHRSSL